MWRRVCVLVVVAGCWSDDPQVNGFTADQWTALQTEFRLQPGQGTVQCGRVENSSVGSDGIGCDLLAGFGQELFWEPAMSTRMGSDGTLIPGTVSCVTCHDPTKWFIDSRTPNNVSMGATKPTARNAMTVVNMALKYDLQPPGDKSFSWIGTFDSAGAVTKLAVEKAMSTQTNVALTAVLAIPHYAAEYWNLFPQAQPSFANLEIALDAYMRRLVSLDSTFDRFIAGQEDAISDSAKRGFAIFVGRGTCISCHKGPAFTDYLVHDTGVPATGSNVDHGLGSDSEGEFVTQSLRNIDRTGPYMHNGSIPTLDAVVDFYRKGGGATDYTGVKDPRIVPLDITDDDARDLVEFLKTLNGGDIATAYTQDIRPKVTCMPGMQACNSTCVSLATDNANCGGCGHACDAGQTCVMGMCTSPGCSTGLSECAVGGCVNLLVDFNHCGSCATMCQPMQACEMGTCIYAPMCPMPLAPCGQNCFDLENNPMNCGACGHVCATTCMNGVCAP